MYKHPSRTVEPENKELDKVVEELARRLNNAYDDPTNSSQAVYIWRDEWHIVLSALGYRLIA